MLRTKVALASDLSTGHQNSLPPQPERLRWNLRRPVFKLYVLEFTALSPDPIYQSSQTYQCSKCGTLSARDHLPNFRSRCGWQFRRVGMALTIECPVALLLSVGRYYHPYNPLGSWGCQRGELRWSGPLITMCNFHRAVK